MPEGIAANPAARVCPECQGLFAWGKRNRVYCSTECYKLYYRREVHGMTPRRYSGEDYARMVELRKAGWPYTTIAEHYGLHPSFVGNIVNSFGEDVPRAFPRECERPDCGKPFTGRADAKYCSATCASVEARRRRRSVVKASRRVELALKQAIQRRLEFNLTGVWRTGNLYHLH